MWMSRKHRCQLQTQSAAKQAVAEKPVADAADKAPAKEMSRKPQQLESYARGKSALTPTALQYMPESAQMAMVFRLWSLLATVALFVQELFHRT